MSRTPPRQWPDEFDKQQQLLLQLQRQAIELLEATVAEQKHTIDVYRALVSEVSAALPQLASLPSSDSAPMTDGQERPRRTLAELEARLKASLDAMPTDDTDAGAAAGHV